MAMTEGRDLLYGLNKLIGYAISCVAIEIGKYMQTKNKNLRFYFA